MKKDTPSKTAHQLWMEFSKANKIEYDYQIIGSKIVDSGDGLLVVSSKVPVIKVVAKYAESK